MEDQGSSEQKDGKTNPCNFFFEEELLHISVLLLPYALSFFAIFAVKDYRTIIMNHSSSYFHNIMQCQSIVVVVAGQASWLAADED